jgi:hypothetical protein
MRRLDHRWRRLPTPVRKLVVGLVGGTLLLIGVAMLVLPGPGLLVSALGIAVLATEFAVAERAGRRMIARLSAIRSIFLERRRS